MDHFDRIFPRIDTHTALGENGSDLSDLVIVKILILYFVEFVSHWVKMGQNFPVWEI